MNDRVRPVFPMPSGSREDALPAAWVSFIQYCRELGHGEISLLKIQDGLPVLAEMTKKKVRFTEDR